MSSIIGKLAFTFHYQTMSSDLSGWLYLCGLPCMWGRRVSWGEKNKKAQREIHQTQQHLTNKARTSPSAAAAVKCFCAFVSPFRHCTVMLHPCLLPFFAAAAVVLLPPSLPFSPQPPQNHLFFSNQVQHLEEEEVPETAFVLCVRTDFRWVEARLRAAAMIRPK